MLLQLRETGQGLVITSPGWLGVLLLVLGVALAVYLARTRWMAKHIGPGMAAVFLIACGIYVLTHKVTLTADGAQAYTPLYRNERIEWSHVASVAVEHRRKRGTTTYIVLGTAAGDALEINITGFSGADEHRIMQYIAARVPKAAAR